jgi:RNA 2',3'-cyclic 3'-phosphodiesterase
VDDDTRTSLARTCAALLPLAGGLPVAWVAPENFHITLKFLGGIDEARVPPIVDALRAAAAGHRAFALEIRGLGAFPAPTRPRVLWAGVTGGGEALMALAGAVDAALAGLGFEHEARAFAAHVTLARVREPRRVPPLADAIDRAGAQRFGGPLIDHVALVRSDLSPRGARYTPLATIPLAS